MFQCISKSVVLLLEPCKNITCNVGADEIDKLVFTLILSNFILNDHDIYMIYKTAVCQQMKCGKIEATKTGLQHSDHSLHSMLYLTFVEIQHLIAFDQC